MMSCYENDSYREQQHVNGNQQHLTQGQLQTNAVQQVHPHCSLNARNQQYWYGYSSKGTSVALLHQPQVTQQFFNREIIAWPSCSYPPYPRFQYQQQSSQSHFHSQSHSSPQYIHPSLIQQQSQEYSRQQLPVQQLKQQDQEHLSQNQHFEEIQRNSSTEIQFQHLPISNQHLAYSPLQQSQQQLQQQSQQQLQQQSQQQSQQQLQQQSQLMQLMQPQHSPLPQHFQQHSPHVKLNMQKQNIHDLTQWINTNNKNLESCNKMQLMSSINMNVNSINSINNVNEDINTPSINDSINDNSINDSIEQARTCSRSVSTPGSVFNLPPSCNSVDTGPSGPTDVTILPLSTSENTNASVPSNNLTKKLKSTNNIPFEWMNKPSYQDQPNPVCNAAIVSSIHSSSPINELCCRLETLGKTRTKEKYRVVYSDFQRLELEKEFISSNHYITIKRKAEISRLLQLTERQVKIWFQNRRAKERKIIKKREEELRKTMGNITSTALNNNARVTGEIEGMLSNLVPATNSPLPPSMQLTTLQTSSQLHQTLCRNSNPSEIGNTTSTFSGQEMRPES